MSSSHPISELTKGWPKKRLKEVERLTDSLRQEMALHELRQTLAMTQKELGKKLKTKQPAVARLEHRTDMYVSTLRDVIQAMGGELEIIAKFPGREVTISNFGEMRP